MPAKKKNSKSPADRHAPSEPAEPASTKKSSGKKPRRTSGALRKSIVDKGGHLIKMLPPERLLDPLLLCPDREVYNLFEYPRLQPGTTDWTKTYNLLATVLRKGVFVTEHGCIIPHYRYCTKGEGAGAGQKAYQLMGTVVYGFTPTGQSPDGITLPDGWSTEMSEANRAAETNRKLRLFNALDWDSTLEASHLCHIHQCMNPLHIVYEPSWRNKKRNYCGIKGQCDCGQVPQCLRTYTPSVQPWLNFQEQNVDRDVLEQLLFQPLRARDLKFSLEQADWLQQREQKADKRNLRIANKKQRDAAAKNQAYQSAKKAARRLSNSLAEAECARANLTSPEHRTLIATAAESAMLKHLSPDKFQGAIDEASDDSDFKVMHAPSVARKLN